MEDHLWKPINLSSNDPYLYHLYFANDVTLSADAIMVGTKIEWMVGTSINKLGRVKCLGHTL